MNEKKFGTCIRPPLDHLQPPLLVGSWPRRPVIFWWFVLKGEKQTHGRNICFWPSFTNHHGVSPKKSSNPPNFDLNGDIINTAFSRNRVWKFHTCYFHIFAKTYILDADRWCFGWDAFFNFNQNHMGFWTNHQRTSLKTRVLGGGCFFHYLSGKWWLIIRQKRPAVSLGGTLRFPALAGSFLWAPEAPQKRCQKRCQLVVPKAEVLGTPAWFERWERTGHAKRTGTERRAWKGIGRCLVVKVPKHPKPNMNKNLSGFRLRFRDVGCSWCRFFWFANTFRHRHLCGRFKSSNKNHENQGFVLSDFLKGCRSEKNQSTQTRYLENSRCC